LQLNWKTTDELENDR